MMPKTNNSINSNITILFLKGVTVSYCCVTNNTNLVAWNNTHYVITSMGQESWHGWPGSSARSHIRLNQGVSQDCDPISSSDFLPNSLAVVRIQFAHGCRTETLSSQRLSPVDFRCTHHTHIDNNVKTWHDHELDWHFTVYMWNKSSWCITKYTENYKNKKESRSYGSNTIQGKVYHWTVLADTDKRQNSQWTCQPLLHGQPHQGFGAWSDNRFFSAPCCRLAVQAGLSWEDLLRVSADLAPDLWSAAVIYKLGVADCRQNWQGPWKKLSREYLLIWQNGLGLISMAVVAQVPWAAQGKPQWAGAFQYVLLPCLHPDMLVSNRVSKQARPELSEIQEETKSSTIALSGALHLESYEANKEWGFKCCNE